MDIKIILEGLKILNFIAIFQALLIVTYLFIQKKGNTNSKIVLALLLIDYCIFLTGTFILLFSQNATIGYIAHLANLTVFLAAPLLYLYFLTLIDPNFEFNYKKLLHTIPFIIILSIMMYEISFQSNHKFMFKPYGIVLLSALFLQNIIYLSGVFKQKSKLELRKIYNQKAKWFEVLFRGIILIFVFKLLIFIIWNIFELVDVCVFFTGLFFILSFVLINMLVIYSLYNPDILTHHVRYQSTPIDKNVNDNCYNDILLCFTEKQMFKDSLLSLKKLAKLLNVSEKQLSQIINENSGDNFNDFVNKYRIKEAQNLLLNDKSNTFNILQIAYEVGFNSKSTFNSAFKKFTGTTPSLYRKNAIKIF